MVFLNVFIKFPFNSGDRMAFDIFKVFNSSKVKLLNIFNV